MKTKQELLKDSQDLTKAIVNYNNFPLTHSLAIAEQFGKEHKHVMRDIKNLKEWLNQAESLHSPNLGSENYIISENHYLNDRKQQQPMYVINKNTALFIIMSYTGDKAKRIKFDFINRFSQLEEEIANKKDNYAGSKGGYKGQFNRVKRENEELKIKVEKLEYLGKQYQDDRLKAETKLNIALKGMLEIAEKLEEVENGRA